MNEHEVCKGWYSANIQQKTVEKCFSIVGKHISEKKHISTCCRPYEDKY